MSQKALSQHSIVELANVVRFFTRAMLCRTRYNLCCRSIPPCGHDPALWFVLRWLTL